MFARGHVWIRPKHSKLSLSLFLFRPIYSRIRTSRSFTVYIHDDDDNMCAIRPSLSTNTQRELVHMHKNSGFIYKRLNFCKTLTNDMQIRQSGRPFSFSLRVWNRQSLSPSSNWTVRFSLEKTVCLSTNISQPSRGSFRWTICHLTSWGSAKARRELEQASYISWANKRLRRGGGGIIFFKEN